MKNNSRKEIILNEILHWKEHNMLPQQYCDYLLAFYSEGEVEQSINRKRKTNFISVKMILSSMIIVFILCLSVFVIYFTELRFVLQTMILTSFVVFLLILGIYYSKKEIWYPLFLAGAALTFLLGSVNMNEHLFNNDSLKLYFTLIINCCLWLLLGWLMRLKFFLFSGICGIAVIIIFILK